MAIGCRAFAVDAQPLCLERVTQSVTASGFPLGDFRSMWTAVLPADSPRLPVGQHKCSGIWSSVFKDERAIVNNESASIVLAPSSSLKEVLRNVPWTITTVKIDLFGGDMHVLGQLLPTLIRTRTVRDVYVEVWGARVHDALGNEYVDDALLDEYTKFFQTCQAAGYGIFYPPVHENSPRKPYTMQYIRHILARYRRSGMWWIRRLDK